MTGPGGASASEASARATVAARAATFAGLAAAAAGQLWFARGSPTAGAGFMVAGIALAALAARRWALDGGAGARPPAALAAWERWFMAAVTVAAAAVRFGALDRWPPGGFFDEAQNVLVARNLLHGHPAVFIPDATQMPALYFYVLAAAVGLLGPHVETARALSALLGTATVPAFYLLARRFVPGAPAAAAAVLLAGSRWHVTFSRVGFAGIVCPLVEILALLALARSFERSRTRDWALLGLTVAIGLQTYYAFNLFPVVLAAGGALLAAGASGAADRRRLARGLAVAAVVAAALLAPLAAYAVAHPHEFFRRTGAVAIWNPENHVRMPGALVAGVRAHLLMFNFHGDENPRHNVQDAPLLTSIEGVLLAFGLGCALGRGRRWPQAVAPVWLAVMLLPGILTIEAPQSYRTIGALPAVFLLIGQGLQVVGAAARRDRGRSCPRAAGCAFVALALAAAAVNVTTYFAIQVTAQRAWYAFETKYTEVAAIVRDEARGYRVWVDPVFYGHPSVRVGLPETLTLTRFVLSDHLPVPRAAAVGTPPGDLYVLDGFATDLVPMFKRAFPQATARRHLDPFGRVALVSISVPWPAGGAGPDPTLARFGTLGAFHRNLTWGGPPVYLRRDPAVFFHFHWDQDGLPGPFSADWAARLRVEHPGEYAFRLVASDPGAIVIDGAVVVAQARAEDLEPLRGSVRLEPGEHVMVVRFLRDGYASALRVWWQPPGARRPSVIPLDLLTPLDVGEYRAIAPALPVPAGAADHR